MTSLKDLKGVFLEEYNTGKQDNTPITENDLKKDTANTLGRVVGWGTRLIALLKKINAKGKAIDAVRNELKKEIERRSLLLISYTYKDIENEFKKDLSFFVK